MNAEVFKNQGSSIHGYYDAEQIIGYDGGKPVTTMRVEIDNDGKIHSHPKDDVPNQCKM